MAYDPADHEVFVTDGSDNLSVVSDATDAVVASVTVGTGAQGVAYDSGHHEVFVADGGSNNVSVVSTASDSVVASIPVCNPPDQGDPDDIAYDPSLGELFVTCYGTSTADLVGVINDTTDTQVATITVEVNPEGVAYDSARGEVFAVNDGSWSVSVISATTDMVTDTISVGSFPNAIVYAPAKGELFVGDAGDNDVSVISDATNSVVGQIPVGDYPSGYDGAAFDSTNGDVFFADQFSNNVSVISDATNYVIQSIPVGVDPQSIVVDSGTGQVFVGNTGSDNVTVATVSAPAISQLVRDTFTEDASALNTALWSVNSPELNATVATDEPVWNDLKMSVYPPNLLDFQASQLEVSPSAGLAINVSGVGIWTGVSSNYVFTPPYSLLVSAKPTDIRGGNPIVICLDNQTAGALLCVFVSNQVYVQIGAADPVPIGGVIASGKIYSTYVNTTSTTASVAVVGPSTSVTWSGDVPFTSGAAQYLTLAAYAGNFPGEGSERTFTDHVQFKSVQLTSEARWSLRVTADDVPHGGTSTPAASQQVYLTDVIDDRVVGSAITDSSGVAKFTGLPSGLYEVSAVANAFDYPTPVVGWKSVMAGNPSDLGTSTVSTTLDLIVPTLVEPEVRLSWTPAETTVWQGSTLNFTASASAGTYNYSYEWFVDGVRIHSASLPYLVTAATSSGVLKVEVKVGCEGSWFEQTCSSNASSTVKINVTSDHYEGALLPYAGSSYIAVGDDGIAGQAGVSGETGVYIDPTQQSVSLKANVTLDFFGGVTIPTVVSSVLGISFPWYTLSISDAAGTVASGSAFQFGAPSLYPTNVTLSPGTPTGTSGPGSLVDYVLNYSMSPRSEYAEALDVVTVILAVLGLGSLGQESSLAANLVNYLLSFDIPLLASLEIHPIGALTQIWQDSWPLILQFLEGIAGTLGLTAIALEIGKDLTAWWTVADALFDLCAILGAVVGGTIWEEYQIQSISPS